MCPSYDLSNVQHVHYTTPFFLNPLPGVKEELEVIFICREQSQTTALPLAIYVHNTVNIKQQNHKYGFLNGV